MIKLYHKEVTGEVSLSGLYDSINLYESTWTGGELYLGNDRNSNYAIDTVVYGAGSNVPGGLKFTPGFPDFP